MMLRKIIDPEGCKDCKRKQLQRRTYYNKVGIYQVLIFLIIIGSKLCMAYRWLS